MQLIRITGLLLIIPLIILISACSKSPEEKAHNALKQANIEYSENSFIKHVENGDKAVADLFLTAGMSPNLRKNDSTEEPILNIAAAYNRAEIVTLLLTKGADVNAKSKEGISALTIATTARGGHTEIVTLLLTRGADFNAKDKEGWTALMEAARLGNIDVVKILIDKGADVGAKNIANQTALMIAMKRTWHDIVDILAKAGATIPKETIEGLLTVADSQWQIGDYQNATQSYQEILSLDPKNSRAKEFLKKYSAVELTHEEVESKFKKEPAYNEFERKEQAKEKKEFLARKEAYYELTDDFAISEYDFKKQRFIVTVGSKTGDKYVPGGGIITVPYALLIVNKDGEEIKFPLYIDKGNAASFAEIEKGQKKLFIIFKLMKVEEYSYYDPIKVQVAKEMGMDFKKLGEYGYVPGYQNSVRRYIKPIYAALITGNKKYILYEEKK